MLSKAPVNTMRCFDTRRAQTATTSPENIGASATSRPTTTTLSLRNFCRCLPISQSRHHSASSSDSFGTDDDDKQQQQRPSPRNEPAAEQLTDDLEFADDEDDEAQMPDKNAEMHAAASTSALSVEREPSVVARVDDEEAEDAAKKQGRSMSLFVASSKCASRQLSCIDSDEQPSHTSADEPQPPQQQRQQQQLPSSSSSSSSSSNSRRRDEVSSTTHPAFHHRPRKSKPEISPLDLTQISTHSQQASENVVDDKKKKCSAKPKRQKAVYCRIKRSNV